MFDLKALQAKARQTFPEADYVHVPSACIFVEHKTRAHKVKSADGAEREIPERTFDKAALETIAAKCNERIADTGNFAVLAEGHTGDGRDADTLGYVGPYRVEQVGDVNPKWAIVADEWHCKDSVSRLKKRPRRSVELWTGSEDMADWFLDPIAALGSDTPRLDMPPVFYARDPQSGREVLRYQAVSPSATNVFVPSTDSIGERKKETYGMDDRDEALVQRIVSLVGDLPGVKWANEQAMKAQAEIEANEAEPTAAPSEDMPRDEASPPASEASVSDDAPQGMDAPPAGEGASPDMEADREKETYEADSAPEPESEEDEDEPPVVPSNAADRAPVEEEYRMIRRYSKRLDDLEQFVERIARNEKDRDRESALDRLATQKHIPAETLDALKDKCLYSRGSDMSEKTFAKELSTLEALAIRNPASIRLPAGSLPSGPMKVDEQTFYDEVHKYCREAQAKGEKYTPAMWDRAKRDVTERLTKGAK